MTAYWNYFWIVVLEWPLRMLRDHADVNLLSFWPRMIFKVVLLGLLGLLVYEFFAGLKQKLRKSLGGEGLVDAKEVAALLSHDKDFSQGVRSSSNPKAVIATLKSAGKYAHVAEAYAALGRPKEAARWYLKAGDRRRAASELVKAGKLLKAAKLALKDGDYGRAGRFYAEKKKYLKAADAYTQAGDFPGAAAAYANAGKSVEAARLFTDYFAKADDVPERQAKAADACLRMLQGEDGRQTVDEADRKRLMAESAIRLARVKRYDEAGKLFQEAGDLGKAGDVYLAAGNLDAAAKCLQAVGRTREAHVAAGRFHEARKQWAEAGAAYAKAGDHARAGDCYAKTEDAELAAQNYAKAGQYYGAGLAYSHMGRFEDAIRQLQRIKESDDIFDQSRALLGRCFYELHDYAHCAATLENHLMGKRVRKDNMDLYYMLSLAHEQVGKLERARDILQKVRSVDVAYRDVATRISNISSRISMGAEAAATPAPQTVAGRPPEADAQVMTMVENLLGGRYRLESELGRGGMGVVYKAEDTQLDRPVAIKFLGSLVDGSESYRKRFVREAKAAAKVNHPNIISIYEISVNVGKTYIAMEFVQGTNLYGYVRDKGKLTPRQAANIVGQACSALQAIHEVGIVHRDVKPDNILIAKGGLVKLMDFGLAKSETSRMTAANAVMGTPSYMSPEQAKGEDADLRTDIYSMGLVLHEALTGETYFCEGDVMERQKTEMPPAPGEMVADIPKEMDDIVMKCVAKDPVERYQTAAELLQAIRSLPK